MADYLDFVTFDEFQAFAVDVFASPSTEEREWVERAIQSFSRTAEHYCNRHFLKKQRTLVFDGDGFSRVKILRAIPVASISSVKTHATGDFASATALDSSYYAVDAESGILRRRSGAWRKGVQNVQIVYTGGLAAIPEDVPRDLKQAALMQVRYWWQRKDKLGLRSQGHDGGSQTIYSTSLLLPEVKDVLDTYRIAG